MDGNGDFGTVSQEDVSKQARAGEMGAKLTSPLATVSLRFWVAGWLLTAAMADCAAVRLSEGVVGSVRGQGAIRLVLEVSCSSASPEGYKVSRSQRASTYLTVQ